MKIQTLKKRTAKFISFIFGPLVWPITLVIVLFKTNLSNQQLSILLPTLLIFQVVIPYCYIFFAYKKKIIRDLDISKRQERYKALIITLSSFLISLIFAYFFGNPLILKLCFLTLIILLINALITLFWKISLHMTINIVAALLINFIFNWQLPILYLSLPLIFWSRLYLKKHSVNQLLGALVLNGVIVLIFVFLGL
jgi:hypothetical protein